MEEQRGFGGSTGSGVDGRDVDYFSITVDGGIAHHGNEVLPKLKQHGVPPGALNLSNYIVMLFFRDLPVSICEVVRLYFIVPTTCGKKMRKGYLPSSIFNRSFQVARMVILGQLMIEKMHLVGNLSLSYEPKSLDGGVTASQGTSRSSILGEVTINIADYADAFHLLDLIMEPFCMYSFFKLDSEVSGPWTECSIGKEILVSKRGVKISLNTLLENICSGVCCCESPAARQWHVHESEVVEVVADQCSSGRSVAQIKAGFIARVGRRKAGT
ncbi:hypothetical protein Tco_1336958 [Tanacetum coccineum]